MLPQDCYASAARIGGMVMDRLVAEFLGTACLVLLGCGAVVIGGFGPAFPVGIVPVAMAFGLTVMAMIYAIGPISGCHINPAVTMGLLVSRKVTTREAVEYWIAQAIGAILAAFVLFVVIKSRTGGYDLSDEGFGANGYGSHSPDGYPLGGALIVEVVLTALLVFTVLASTDRIANVAFAGIPIGLVLTLIHLVGIPVDNLSVNPARSLGPAVFVGGWALGQLWLFIVAPLIGGAIGAVIHRALFEDQTQIAPEESAVAADPADPAGPAVAPA
jgi:aquaporin Z